MNYGRTHGAPFRGYGYVPLRNGGNVVTRIGTQQQQQHMNHMDISILRGKRAAEQSNSGSNPQPLTIVKADSVRLAF